MCCSSLSRPPEHPLPAPRVGSVHLVPGTERELLARTTLNTDNSDNLTNPCCKAPSTSRRVSSSSTFSLADSI